MKKINIIFLLVLMSCSNAQQNTEKSQLNNNTIVKDSSNVIIKEQNNDSEIVDIESLNNKIIDKVFLSINKERDSFIEKKEDILSLENIPFSLDTTNMDYFRKERLRTHPPYNYRVIVKQIRPTKTIFRNVEFYYNIKSDSIRGDINLSEGITRVVYDKTFITDSLVVGDYKGDVIYRYKE